MSTTTVKPETQADQKTFFLGLGHQKSGTTWLHEYLSQNANFEGGVIKEYHVWDSRDIPLLRKQFLSWNHPFKTRAKRKRYQMIKDDAVYFDYFESLYGNGITMSADITPSYSGLSCSTMEHIKEQFIKKGITVKVVILIRDPINRMKSAVRYNLDKKNYKEGINQGETDFAEALKQYSQSEHCKVRTSYHETIEKAYKVFGQESVYVGVFESMFDISEIERLSEFCGVPVKPEFAKVFVNKTKNKVEDVTDLENKIKEAYSDVYSYCNENFPSTKELWAK